MSQIPNLNIRKFIIWILLGLIFITSLCYRGDYFSKDYASQKTNDSIYFEEGLEYQPDLGDQFQYDLDELPQETTEDHVIEKDDDPLLQLIYQDKPLVAIVMDDLGYNLNQIKSVLKLDIPITLSILPFLPYTKLATKMGQSSGQDILLHIPLEAEALNFKLGAGAIFTNMDRETIVKALDDALDDLSGVDDFSNVVGVNNHMGSLFTADSAKMEILLRHIKKRGLFFLDSKTTSASKSMLIAKQINLNVVERDIFLDNNQDVVKIKNNIRLLIKRAKSKGSAIGIAHPYPETIIAIAESIPLFESEDVILVKISDLFLKPYDQLK
ncbi:MAG: divergent polysaccharide deacetylase family protein [Nitrospinota bacterium]